MGKEQYVRPQTAKTNTKTAAAEYRGGLIFSAIV